MPRNRSAATPLAPDQTISPTPVMGPKDFGDVYAASREQGSNLTYKIGQKIYETGVEDVSNWYDTFTGGRPLSETLNPYNPRSTLAGAPPKMYDVCRPNLTAAPFWKMRRGMKRSAPARSMSQPIQ
jgi:hypothetical protein